MTIIYLDPGSGSILVQFLIAAVTGIILFFKQIKLIIKDIFFSRFKNKKENK
jgi:hypothetical protein